MGMRTLVLAAIVSLVCIHSGFGYEVCSFVAPGTSISGLACGEAKVWVVDPSLDVIFGLEPLEEFAIVVIIDCQVTDPDGLAWADCVLYYSSPGSTLLYATNTDGTFIGSFDLAPLGVQSITGIGYDFYNVINEDCLFILDAVQEKVFRVSPLLEFTEAEELIDLTGLSEMHDITGGDNYIQNSAWIACGTCSEPAQVWDDYYGFVYGMTFYGVSTVTEIAQDQGLNPNEHIWIYDPITNIVGFWYWGTSLDTSTWGSIKSTF
jgi:hypothetical protein